MGNKNWQLSPSDFAFLWEDCKRCFYLKVNSFYRPRSIMPKIFTIIDGEMKKFFKEKQLEKVVVGFPAGKVEFGERWVESSAISMPGLSSTCTIKGKFDTVVRFNDGSYGIIDFKTAETKSEHIPLYSRQLHAYAHALENPSTGALALKPITKLGLLVYEPNNFLMHTNQSASLSGRLSWIEIQRNDKDFLRFLKEVVTVLEQPKPPGGNPACEWCKYRDTSRRIGL